MASEQWLAAQVVEKAADAIVVADAQGLVRLWNGGAERLFGFSADEIIGHSLELIIPENLRARHRQGYEQTMATGQTRYSRDLLAVPAMRKDGRRISIEFTIALIHDDAGRLLGPAAIIRDVTERWSRERESRKQMAALEAELARHRAGKAGD